MRLFRSRSNTGSQGTIVLTIVAVIAVAALLLSYNNYQRVQAINDLQMLTDVTYDEAIVDQYETALTNARETVNFAYNLLSLFEVLSVVLTITGAVAANYVLRTFSGASLELEEARQTIEMETQEVRERLEMSLIEREKEIEMFRQEIETALQSERMNTSNSLLANALLSLGERQYRASDYQGAVNTYNRAHDLDPENPVVNQRLGYIYIQMGDYEKAKQYYEDALKRDPTFAPALAGQGFVYRRMGEQTMRSMSQENLSYADEIKLNITRDQFLNESERLLLKALELSPKLVDDDGESYWGLLGGLYKRRGQVEQAINAYKRVTEVTPQSSYGFSNLAFLYTRTHDVNNMLQTYRQVERIAQYEAEATAGNFWGNADLIISSYAIGKIEQAEKTLPVAISIAPFDSPYMLEGLVDTLEDLMEALAKDTQYKDRVQAIGKSINILNAELAQREQALKDEEQDTTDE